VDRDVPARGADGERHLLASVFRVDAGGRTIGVGGIVRDVTELRRAEEFRRHLLAIVGHDLRSPLAAITVSVGLLLRQHRLEQREVATLSRVLASAGKIERILRDLLDWASAEAGHTLPLSPREASIADVCRGAADEALAVDPARSVAVEGEGDPRGRWDPDRLAQVLGNLVGNAFKHGRAGAPVRVRWRGTGDEVAVEVENQGEPIPPALRRRIFEPFRRGAATGGPGGGLGLGLYIARELVRAHGGTIAVRSGGGTTTFTVRLPRAAAAP
jgi:signal transduction histidine kinase